MGHMENDVFEDARKPVVLTVPGLNGSDDDHWQTRWEAARRDCRRAELGNWESPAPLRWLTQLDAAIGSIPGPVVLAAHSLGCIATVSWALRFWSSHANVVGALLVAPCDAEALDVPVLRRFAPIPRAALPFPSIVVASENDPYASVPRLQEMAEAWGSQFVNVGARGHINSKSNLGTWSAGQAFLDALLMECRVSARLDDGNSPRGHSHRTTSAYTLSE
jgi:predicted alpha/beta hydrolase family esterase